MRPAEDRAGYLSVDDRWLAERVAVGVAEARADGNCRDIDVLALLEHGCGFVDIGLRETHARVVLEGEIDGGDERDLGVRALKGRGEHENREDQERRRCGA